MLTIRFFVTPAGASPVEKFLDSLEDVEAAKVAAALRDLQLHGLSGTSSLRQIAGKLWELRVSATRVFYVLLDGSEMVLLHAYKKQGQKAPRNEIAVATKRMKAVLDE